MTCQELIDFILDYIEGRLPQTQRAEFERHLTGCPCCVNYLKQYNDTVAMARAALAANKSDGAPVPEQLVHAILAAKRAAK